MPSLIRIHNTASFPRCTLPLRLTDHALYIFFDSGPIAFNGEDDVVTSLPAGRTAILDTETNMGAERSERTAESFQPASPEDLSVRMSDIVAAPLSSEMVRKNGEVFEAQEEGTRIGPGDSWLLEYRQASCK